ncbi:peptidase [Streptomyces sp. NPDC096176]|uniref:peptidase n=1 Tax=Streptomyces sp. NPDC096176 TaxID=3366079 RepID=UPI003808353F
MALEEIQNAEKQNADTHDAEVQGAQVGGAAEAVQTMAAKRYPVAPGVRLNVRSGPGTQYRLVKILPYGAGVPIYCQKPGETIAGPYGTTDLWDNIANGQFVSDAYVQTGSDGYVAPRCS